MSRKSAIVWLLIPTLCLQAIVGSAANVSAYQASPVPAVAVCDVTATPIAQDLATPVASPAASPSSVSPEFDQLYLDLMIVQQEHLIEVARIGTVKANARELQRLSEEIVSSSEANLEQLRATRGQLYDGAPLKMGPQLMAELDAISREQPGAGGVPGAMEIVAGNNIVAELCVGHADLDRSLTDALIEQLDAGVVLSGVANDLAKHEETKTIAAEIVKTNRPFEDGAIAVRDGILGRTPVATPASSGF